MVTYRSVAARASVTHGLVRHYFGTREAMLAEAMQLAAGEDMATISLATSSIEDFGRGVLEALDSDLSRQLLQYDLTLNAIRGVGDKKVAVEIYDHYIGEVAKTLREIGADDPRGEWATLVLAALDGIILQHALYDSAERTEAVLEKVRQLLHLLADRGRAPGD
jgi:AcrR family transcriptional regulator